MARMVMRSLQFDASMHRMIIRPCSIPEKLIYLQKFRNQIGTVYTQTAVQFEVLVYSTGALELTEFVDAIVLRNARPVGFGWKAERPKDQCELFKNGRPRKERLAICHSERRKSRGIPVLVMLLN